MDRYNKEQYNPNNRCCGDKNCCCRPSDGRYSETRGQTKQSSPAQYYQNEDNMPSTSRYMADEACFNSFSIPSNNEGRSNGANESSFRQSGMQDFMDKECNKACNFRQAQKSKSMNKENILIEDTYEPGLIEDSVECKKDFNAVSFGLFFGSIQHIPKKLPPKTPMSLVEAFSKRIDYERNHLLNATTTKKADTKLTLQSIDTFFSNKPTTNLNTALSNLYKAEALFEEQKTAGGTKGVGEQPYDLDLKQSAKPMVGGSPILVETIIGSTTPKGKPKKKGCF